MGNQQYEYTSLNRWIADQRKVKKSQLPADVQAAIKVDITKRNAKQKKRLLDFFLLNISKTNRKTFAPLLQKQKTLNAQTAGLSKSMPTTLIWKETAKPRPAFILKRGEYDQEGDPVTRITPASLPPMPLGASKDRMGLAQWLTMKNHPLTARVTVNRFWQQLFGTGIVKTSEDFGSQGEPPTHPQLLDWLAVDFVNSGWNVKQLMKKMVLSASYRQASTLTAKKLQLDPANRLISRGPRFRLDAEMMRDQALFLSGMLVHKIGGPSVKPPQPAGLWFAVGYSGSNTVRFKQDQGDSTYRRSLYTFWKRTAPPPQMSIIDAPSRESCTVRRERTNTPLLALLLMNEQQFFESARRLGELTMKQSGDIQAKAAWMFERATLHPPSHADLTDLVMLYNDNLAVFTKDPQAAKDTIGVGDSKADVLHNVPQLAAWTMVGNLVLNLDEVINKN